MATVRKRTWSNSKGEQTAWIADYFDNEGKRHIKTFHTEGEASEYLIEINCPTKSLAEPTISPTPDPPIHFLPDIPLLSYKEIMSLPEANQDSGVYFLILGSEIQYVGKSINVHSRIRSHKKRDEIEFDKCVWVRCNMKDLDILESLYIRELAPPFNYVGIYEE